MKKAWLLFLILVLSATACNLPGGITPLSGATAKPTLMPVTPLPPTPTLTATQTLVPASPLPPTPTMTATFLPPDLPFYIDCSAIDANRLADCNAYLAYTHDKVYPILRDVTGVSLSKCYPSITYTIVPHETNEMYGGLSDGANISYAEQYSIDAPIPFDVHELIHSISDCSGALDAHVFHGLLMSYVYDQLHDPRADSFIVNEHQSSNLLRRDITDANKASGADLFNQCNGILVNQVEMTYFQKSDKASIQTFYRGTIPPVQLDKQPNATLISMWGNDTAKQVEAVLEMLTKDYNISLKVPVCGY